MLALPMLLLGGVACGGGDGDSSAKWCDIAEKINDAEAEQEDLDFSDPDALEQALDDFRAQIKAAAKVAPDEIKDAVEESADTFEEGYQLFADADFDINGIDPAALDEIDSAEADAEIEAYNEKECGIDSSSSDSGSTDTEATDDTAAPGDTVGEIDGLGSLNDLYARLGLTEEETSCLQEHVAELAAVDQNDTTAMLGVFSDCGIDIARLAELGSDSGG